MEAYLERCLASLLVEDAALRLCLDVIIVNDGSKDRTSEIAHAFADSHNPEGFEIFRVIDKENGNYGSCVNVGLVSARGRFVRVLDADDYFDTAAFERYLCFLVGIGENDTPDLILTDHDKVSATGEALASHPYPFAPIRVFGIDELLPHLASIGMLGMTYRLGLLKSIDYSQTEGISYTDNEFVIIPMLFVKRIVYCPECVYHYFIGREGQTISVMSTPRSIGMYIRLFNSLGTRISSLKSNGVAEENRAFVDGYIRHLIGFVYSNIVYGLTSSDFNKCFCEWDTLVKNKYGGIHYDIGVVSVVWRIVPYMKILRRLQSYPTVQKLFLGVLRLPSRIRAIFRRRQPTTTH